MVEMHLPVQLRLAAQGKASKVSGSSLLPPPSAWPKVVPAEEETHRCQGWAYVLAPSLVARTTGSPGCDRPLHCPAAAAAWPALPPETPRRGTPGSRWSRPHRAHRGRSEAETSTAWEELHRWWEPHAFPICCPQLQSMTATSSPSCKSCRGPGFLGLTLPPSQTATSSWLLRPMTLIAHPHDSRSRCRSNEAEPGPAILQIDHQYPCSRPGCSERVVSPPH